MIRLGNVRNSFTKFLRYATLSSAHDDRMNSHITQIVQHRMNLEISNHYIIVHKHRQKLNDIK